MIKLLRITKLVIVISWCSLFNGNDNIVVQIKDLAKYF